MQLSALPVADMHAHLSNETFAKDLRQLGPPRFTQPSATTPPPTKYKCTSQQACVNLKADSKQSRAATHITHARATLRCAIITHVNKNPEGPKAKHKCQIPVLTSTKPGSAHTRTGTPRPSWRSSDPDPYNRATAATTQGPAARVSSMHVWTSSMQGSSTVTGMIFVCFFASLQPFAGFKGA